MAEAAYALKDILARTKPNQKAFSDLYQGTQAGARLRRGLADDPEALVFFDNLILLMRLQGRRLIWMRSDRGAPAPIGAKISPGQDI